MCVRLCVRVCSCGMRCVAFAVVAVMTEGCKAHGRAHQFPTTNTTTPQNIKTSNRKSKSGDDAGELRWFPLKDAVSGAVEFAFDHGEIVKDGAAWFEREGRRMGMYVEVVEGG